MTKAKKNTTAETKTTEAAQTLRQIIDQNAADNAKLADKLNSVAEAAIDAMVEVMQDNDTCSALKLQAAQTLFKARQEVNDRLLKDEARKKEAEEYAKWFV